MKEMKAWLLIAAALTLFGALPVRGTDVAELLPARVLTVSRDGTEYRIKSDNGSEGRGGSIELALADLRRTAEGTLYLGTVEQVIVSASAWDALAGLVSGTKLRPAAKLYYAFETPDAAQAQAFLEAHPGSLTLGKARALLLTGQTVRAPRIIEEDGRLRLGE